MFKYYLPQQKVLRQILEKVKFTHCKTSRTLKIDVFGIPHYKSIGKFFSKYELLFLDPANSSSYPSQILILQLPMTETPLQHSPRHVLHRFHYFALPHSATRHHKYWIYQTICQA